MLIEYISIEQIKSIDKALLKYFKTITSYISHTKLTVTEIIARGIILGIQDMITNKHLTNN